MKLALKFSALALAMGISSLSLAADFVEGKDYRVIANPENISGDVIVVREFFWYGCPHCFRLETHMQKWAANRAKDVAFFRTPASLNPAWEIPARGFYAAQMMGFEEKTHHALFNTIHVDGKRVDTSQSQLADWYASKGVDKNKFNSLFNSFAVSAKIERSRASAQRYKLSGVPAVVVNGKYVVSGEDAKVTQVVDFLVNKVRNEKK